MKVRSFHGWWLEYCLIPVRELNVKMDGPVKSYVTMETMTEIFQVWLLQQSHHQYDQVLSLYIHLPQADTITVL